MFISHYLLFCTPRNTIMWKIILFSLFIIGTVSVWGFGDPIGPGQWMVLNVRQCDDAETYEILFEVSRKKMNRTHDAFNVYINLDRELNMTYAAEIEAYKEVDGGFKFYTKLNDECACTFIKKYTGHNMEKALTMAGIEPPDCPIPPGEVLIEDFVFDYTQLNENGMYGVYDARAYLLYAGVRVMCVRLLVSFEEVPENDEDYD